ncbi:MAG: cytochrome c-type biogenesis CcmF C-terminal domain-containing protein, partial [Pseudomonadota bacterium]|nr:cytochrome c-type biogenesis CcmF C-terminal domain-containing protein [Pseudomonadota bacterium]
PIIGFAIAGWLGGGALKELADRILLFKIPLLNSLLRARGLPRSAYGMTLAHLGIAIFVCGASADSAWRSEVVFNAKEKDQTEIAGFNLKLQKVDRLKGPNYETERAHILVTKDSKIIANLYPERRFYPVQQMLTTEATIYSTVMADLYATIGEGDKRNGWVLRIWYNPLIPWIWLGCLLMVLGGVISLTDRRLRIGAPEKKIGNYKTAELGAEHG